MANITTANPIGAEVASQLIAGITAGLNKISNILNMKTAAFTDVQLNALEIDTESANHNRIYAIDVDRKCWLTSPSVVVKKNGSVIQSATAGFSIDYLGGSITFDEPLLDSDVITATGEYITNGSTVITALRTDIDTALSQSSKYKGYFATEDDLTSVVSPQDGDIAFVESPNYAIYAYATANGWQPTKQEIDLSSYLTSDIVKQVTGESTTDVMSQKAVTDKFSEQQGSIDDINAALGNKAEKSEVTPKADKTYVDTQLSSKLDSNGDGKNVTQTFTEAATRENIATGEKSSTIFGKIKKFFTDLKTVAFSGSYADLTSIPNDFTPALHKNTHETGGTDAIAPADIGAQPAITTSGVLKSDGAGNISKATYNDLDDKPTEFTPENHKSTHATGGKDAIAPADIGAQPKITADGILKGDGQGNITAVESAGISMDSKSVAIAVSDWTASGEQFTATKTVNDITDTDNIIITADPDSFSAWAESTIYCSAQANQSLTFTAEQKPDAPVTMNLLILR